MSALILEAVSVRRVVVPLRRPVIAAIGRFDEWPLVLVDVRTTDGVVGRSYVTPYRASAMPSIAAEIEDLAAMLLGTDVSPVDAFARARQALNVVGEAGISQIATSALDMAFWDARAVAAGLPLVELLGGSVGDVRAYNSNGLWRQSPNTLAAEAAELLTEGGFDTLKLRLGNIALKDDLAAIAAVRDGVGDRVNIMVDFNQALGTGDAIRRCHELDDEGLYWFEEPIDYSNLTAYRQLARVVRTPLQLGENYYGARDLYNFSQSGVAQYAMADLMRIGGVTGWMRAAGIGEGAGVQLSNHLYPEFSAHLLRVTPTAHWCEWVDWADPVVAEPLVPHGGKLTVSSRPGAGIAWDEDAVEKYLVR
jgi:mandelate racemase